MLERNYQPRVIRDIEEMFPGAIIMKNDPGYIQGIPDLTVLVDDMWATLETKRRRNARRQPNQEYYVDLMNRMSFSAFIDPDNHEETLRELEYTFEELRRPTRFSKR